MGTTVFIFDVWPEASDICFTLEEALLCSWLAWGWLWRTRGLQPRPQPDVFMQETNDQDAVARAIERYVLSQS